MKKYVMLVCIAIAALGIGYYLFSNWARCFENGGGSTIVPVSELHGDQEIRSGLNRIAVSAEIWRT